MSNVIKFPNANQSVDDVLESALEAKDLIESIVVIASMKTGQVISNFSQQDMSMAVFCCVCAQDDVINMTRNQYGPGK